MTKVNCTWVVYGIGNLVAQQVTTQLRTYTYITNGYLVLRFGWHHLSDPDYVIAMVRRALAMQAPVSRQDLGPWPPMQGCTTESRQETSAETR